VPELPEVESVRRGLVGHVVERPIESVEVLNPRAVRRHVAGARDLSARLVGASFGVPRRRGKYLWLPLDDGESAMVAHLGMSGQFRAAPAGSPDEPHLRVRWTFRDGADELRFIDQRTFGSVCLEPVAADGVPVGLGGLALDPFEPEYDLQAASRALRRRRTQVKRALLDQTLVSGIGNIYADEALWRVRLHHARPTQRLTAAQARGVLQAASDVMAEALEAGGTSFDDLYVHVNGESGYFERSLHAYGREGQPCDRCGTPIRREAFMNRSSFLCPRCQPQARKSPRSPDRVSAP